MPAIPHRLLTVICRVIMEELRRWGEELAVAVDGAWEGFGEPVQRGAVEDLVEDPD